MNFLKLSLLAAAMLAMGSASVSAQSADEIMEKHVTAIGGVDNWNNVKTMKIVGSMSQQGMEITMTQTFMFGKASRTDISAMGMNGWIITTQKDGWMYMPFMGGSKIDTMKPEMVKMQQKQLDIKGHQMLDYKTNGSKLELAGRDTINKAPCFKVKMTDKEGNETVCYFDCATYYLLRTEQKVKRNDEEQEIDIAYDNFKKLDGGIVMASSVNAAGQELTYKSIEVNKPVDESIFIPAMEKSDAKSNAPAPDGPQNDPKK